MRHLRTNTLVTMLAAASLVSVISSCATTASQIERDAIDEITSQLVEDIETRADTRKMLVYVHSIHAMSPDGLSPRDGTRVTSNLEHHIVLSLSQRLRLVEGEMAAVPAPPDAALGNLTRHYGATHYVVGDYSVRGCDINLSMRLVDAETNIIVAAAGGALRGIAPRPTRYPGLYLGPSSADRSHGQAAAVTPEPSADITAGAPVAVDHRQAYRAIRH